MNFDPALGDLALAEARDSLAQGDWDAARDLLTASRGGRDGWDRRSHRIRVLAEAVANSAWVERWQVLDPTNPDPATLRAQVETIRVLRATSASVSPTGVSQASTSEALEACRHAAEMSPEDPTPWVAMLTLARAVDHFHPPNARSRDEFWRRWQEMRARDPFNRDGHHEALAYLYASWCGSHTEMYDFAYWLAGEAPSGSPLAVLPLVAHAEAYRAVSIGTSAHAPPSPQAHWGNEQVVTDVERVMRSWLSSATVRHAQADMDRNHLLHAMVFAGLGETDEARALFDAIGSHAMRIPWSYTGDAESSFLYWRSRAFGIETGRR